MGNHIAELFFSNNDRTITYEQFCQQIETEAMQEYFKSINVDPSEATVLYKLLDIDNSGGVDAEEMVNGCLRLRGGAKALDLSLLLYETTRMNQMIELCHGDT